jgi:hypothetical protein
LEGDERVAKKANFIGAVKAKIREVDETQFISRRR